MAKTPCKYHPQRPARWGCSACGINFCSDCKSADSPDEAACPLCQAPATDIGRAGLVPPFWTRLGSFFLYPFRSKALLLLLGLAGLSALIGYTSLPALIGQFALLLIFMKYAYSALAHAANGYREPLSLLTALGDGDVGIAFKQYFALIVLSIPMGLLARLVGEWAGVVYYFLLVLCLPASVMVLAVDRSFWSAVNPVVLMGTVLRIGVPYLALFFLVMLLSGGPTIIFQKSVERVGAEYIALKQEDPQQVDRQHFIKVRREFRERFFRYVIPITVLSNMYFILVMFVLMGYVVYQYHWKLGFAPELDFETLERGGTQPTGHPLLGDIEAMIKEGQLQQATETVRRRVIENPMDMTLRMRFHKLLLATGDVTRLCGHGGEFIGKLLRGSDRARAVEVYADCKKINPDFTLDSPDQVLPLAEVMFQLGRHRQLLGLSNGFHERYPQHPDIPKLYLLVARAMAEGLNREEKALPLLRFLSRRYGDHPLANEINNYLGVITNLRAST